MKNLIKSFFKIFIAIIVYFMTFIAVVLPWNCRHKYTTKVCDLISKLMKRSKFINRFALGIYDANLKE